MPQAQPSPRHEKRHERNTRKKLMILTDNLYFAKGIRVRAMRLSEKPWKETQKKMITYNHPQRLIAATWILFLFKFSLTFGVPLFDTVYLVLYLLRDRKSWRHHLDALRLPLFVSKAEITAGLSADMDTFGPQYARSWAVTCPLAGGNMERNCGPWRGAPHSHARRADCLVFACRDAVFRLLTMQFTD